LERNWKCWKEGKVRGQRAIETIKEKKEKVNQENSGLRE